MLTTLSARSKSRGSCWLRFEIERSCSPRGTASRAQRGRRARRHTVPRLLDPHDHRQALVTLAEPALGCWRATRHLVEALIHCVLTGPAVVPRLCVVGTPLPPTLYDAFVARFGVPLRRSVRVIP